MPVGIRVSIEVATLLLRLAWVSSAPFGWPVVPEVYRITAVSSAVRLGDLGDGSAPASSRVELARQR